MRGCRFGLMQIRLARSHPLFLAVFVFVLAPIAAFVVVTMLLAIGVTPHTVFAPGWAVLSLLKAIGIRVPNAVGVVSTVALWWAVFVIVGLAWERRAAR